MAECTMRPSNSTLTSCRVRHILFSCSMKSCSHAGTASFGSDASPPLASLLKALLLVKPPIDLGPYVHHPAAFMWAFFAFIKADPGRGYLVKG